MSGADYVWLISYVFVVLGLSAFGIHRYAMVYLFLKNSRRKPEPSGHFEDLPLVTIQLPVFNEQHVVARLVDAVARLDYPRHRLQIQMLDDSTDGTTAIAAPKAVPRATATAAQKAKAAMPKAATPRHVRAAMVAMAVAAATPKAAAPTPP